MQEKKEIKMYEYTNVLSFLIFSFVLSGVIVLASYALGVKKPDSEKSNVYECGFSPYSDSRSEFEVRFFLVGILFIIFDLEISFLFPWSVSISSDYNIFSYFTMMLFLGILTVGLVYEWLKGGLEWE